MENQKRSAERNAGEDEECDDKKIEEFFALIRNFKDVKDQLNDRSKRRRQSESDADDHHRRSAGAWVPAFQWEDFTTEVEFRKPSSDLPPPCDSRKEIIKTDDEVNRSSGLELKLTL